jgi:cytochrome bd-type quinol oxidase subunit 1
LSYVKTAEANELPKSTNGCADNRCRRKIEEKEVKGMNYPFWEVPMIGGGMLIGIVAIVHVFVAHFAVGGGLFLPLTEYKAYRENDPRILDYVKRHTLFFVLLTLVTGAITGVGIWWTIGLVHPPATRTLLLVFVWVWATEWVMFFTEIAAALIYYYGWISYRPKPT